MKCVNCQNNNLNGFDVCYTCENEYQFKTNEMTCEKFFDEYFDNNTLYAWIDEMYWEDNFSSEKMMKVMIDVASEKQVVLTDVDDWDYDKFFFNVYKNTEKGLS